MKSSLKIGVGRTAPLSVRRDDLYETPPVAVRALLRVESFSGLVWEPACGPGAIARELRAAGLKVLATDLVDYASEDQDASGWDFLFSCDQRADAIVTNPPYKLAQEFVELALERAPKVAMLLRLLFLESERRRRILEESSLARVHVFRNRLPMMCRSGFDKPKQGNALAFAWFVWERGHKGPAQLHRMSWERDV